MQLKSTIVEAGGVAEIFIADFTKIDLIGALISFIKQKTDPVDVTDTYHGKEWIILMMLCNLPRS